MQFYRTCQAHLTLGTVLDGKYCLISELSAEDGRPRFVAEDLINNREVELIVLSGAQGPRGYNIRPRAETGHADATPHECDRRALERFTERVSLTGVSIRAGERLVFSGWDRKRGKPVRVVVEELDD